MIVIAVVALAALDLLLVVVGICVDVRREGSCVGEVGDCGDDEGGHCISSKVPLASF